MDLRTDTNCATGELLKIASGDLVCLRAKSHFCSNDEPPGSMRVMEFPRKPLSIRRRNETDAGGVSGLRIARNSHRP